ncbi:hypothetical protein RP20_CCG017265 [Aedes albopictus]|nr:hypothetical protein RP20_CCG017265 [Aedes albopictus]
MYKSLSVSMASLLLALAISNLGVHGVQFENCDEQLPELKAVVHGIILGMEVPFNLPNPDGCKDSGLECPLAAGTEYKYSTTLPVLKQYPKVAVEVKWELKSGGKDVICVKIPAKIQ